MQASQRSPGSGASMASGNAQRPAAADAGHRTFSVPMPARKAAVAAMQAAPGMLPLPASKSPWPLSPLLLSRLRGPSSAAILSFVSVYPSIRFLSLVSAA